MAKAAWYRHENLQTFVGPYHANKNTTHTHTHTYRESFSSFRLQLSNYYFGIWKHFGFWCLLPNGHTKRNSKEAFRLSQSEHTKPGNCLWSFRCTQTSDKHIGIISVIAFVIVAAVERYACCIVSPGLSHCDQDIKQDHILPTLDVWELIKVVMDKYFVSFCWVLFLSADLPMTMAILRPDWLTDNIIGYIFVRSRRQRQTIVGETNWFWTFGVNLFGNSHRMS